MIVTPSHEKASSPKDARAVPDTSSSSAPVSRSVGCSSLKSTITTIVTTGVAVLSICTNETEM